MKKLILFQEVYAMIREKVNFNTEWLYSSKDYTDGELKNFQEAEFEQVSIPHANTLLTRHKGPDFQEQIESYRFISWYRRHFILDESYKEKEFLLNLRVLQMLQRFM